MLQQPSGTDLSRFRHEAMSGKAAQPSNGPAPPAEPPSRVNE